MTIEELLKSSANMAAVRDKLRNKKKSFAVPLEKVLKEIDPMKHDVMNPDIRPPKRTNVPTGRRDEMGKEIMETKSKDVARVTVPLQRIIVERTVGFFLGKPVEYKASGELDEKARKLMDEVKKVFRQNKINYFDKNLCRKVFIGREAAELWYHVPTADGRPSGDLKVKLLSPLMGDELLPHFDDYDRMDGFARLYQTVDEDGKTHDKMDVYTERMVYKYIKNEDGDFVEHATPKPHGFDRLPVVYYRQDESEWASVQKNIDRIEFLLSSWADTNDYYGSPSYFVKGKISGFAEKGETGKVYQSNDGSGEMKVLSWDSSPTSVTSELGNLFNIVFSYTQTPDVSFETMKTLGNNTSGAAIRLMFTDPHMKMRVKEELFGEMLTRRYNIVKSATGTLNGYTNATIESIDIEPVFYPYIPENVAETISMLKNASQSSIMSQESAVRQNPLVDNPEEEIKNIVASQQAAMMADLLNPTE